MKTPSLVTNLAPPPAGRTTVVGGILGSLDQVRDRLTLKIFGGGHLTVLFDERTQLFRDGKAKSLDELKNGDRVYIDTTLDGDSVFARNIRISSAPQTGQGDGQVIAFDPRNGDLLLRETLVPVPVKMRLTSDAIVLRENQAVDVSRLSPGTLVSIVFEPGKNGEASVRKISIVASPGAICGFSGRVEYIDLHTGLVAVVDPRNNKSYDIHFEPGSAMIRELHEGTNISVQASFDGTRYEARTLTLHSAPSE
ncbi:MAG: DUF5666 domain-containing protein [Terriglobales bacterium]